MRRATWARRAAPGGLVVALAVTVGACNLITPLDPSMRAAFLTPEGGDDYGITLDGGAAVTAAPTTNKGGNTRLTFWSAGATPSTDQMSCTSWVEGAPGSQQGVALRIRSEGGRTTAVTVTKNVWWQAWWLFNVHVMDSGRTDAPFVLIGSVNASGALIRDGLPAPGPWRLCARVIGDLLSMKVWAADEPEPEWMDGVHGGGVVLPAGWDLPGSPGWYVGHLSPGTSTSYTERHTIDLDVTDPPPTTVTTSPEDGNGVPAPETGVQRSAPGPVTPEFSEAPSTSYLPPLAIERAP